MLRRRLVVSLYLGAVLLVGGAAVAIGQRMTDPLDDYRSLRQRAQVEGSTIVAARGEVVSVHGDNLLEIESEQLFPQRLWVLSRAPRDVPLGARIAVEGTLCPDGVLVADALTIYQGQMHG
jgi:hypothetical protein